MTASRTRKGASAVRSLYVEKMRRAPSPSPSTGRTGKSGRAAHHCAGLPNHCAKHVFHMARVGRKNRATIAAC